MPRFGPVMTAMVTPFDDNGRVDLEGAAALAQWLIAAGHAPDSYVAAQGTTLARAGRVHVQKDAAGEIWIGGSSVTCIDGTVEL